MRESRKHKELGKNEEKRRRRKRKVARPILMNWSLLDGILHRPTKVVELKFVSMVCDRLLWVFAL